MCWSVLECVGVCCIVLHCVGVCCSVLQCVACSELQVQLAEELGIANYDYWQKIPELGLILVPLHHAEHRKAEIGIPQKKYPGGCNYWIRDLLLPWSGERIIAEWMYYWTVWISNVTYECVMLHIDESYNIHIVMSHVNKSCVTKYKYAYIYMYIHMSPAWGNITVSWGNSKDFSSARGRVAYAWITSHMNVLCHVWMRRVKY